MAVEIQTRESLSKLANLKQDHMSRGREVQ